MRWHRSVLPFIVALLLAAGAIVMGCGDGDDDSGSLTLEEYFGQVSEIMDDANTRLEALQERYGDGTPTSEDISDVERISAIREWFQEVSEISRDSQERFSQLHPPAEVRDAHNEYVDAGEDVSECMEEWVGSEGFEEYIIELAEAESRDELTQVQEAFRDSHPDLVAAYERSDEACADLERIAADNGIDLDLGCG